MRLSVRLALSIHMYTKLPSLLAARYTFTLIMRT